MTQILKFHPENHILIFHRDPQNKNIWKAVLRLENTSNKDICFKVRVTHTNVFKVKPNIGVLSADEKIVFLVVTVENEEAFSLDKEKSYKFLIQSCYVPEGGDLAHFDPIKIWKNPVHTNYFIITDQVFSSFFIYGDRKPEDAAGKKKYDPGKKAKKKIEIDDEASEPTSGMHSKKPAQLKPGTAESHKDHLYPFGTLEAYEYAGPGVKEKSDQKLQLSTEKNSLLKSLTGRKKDASTNKKTHNATNKRKSSLWQKLCCCKGGARPKAYDSRDTRSRK